MENFKSQKNQALLFNILKNSQINIQDEQVLKIIRETFNEVIVGVGPSLNVNKLSLIRLNKLFIKMVMNKKKKTTNQNQNNYMNYENKDVMKKRNIEALDKKVEKQQKDLDSFKKKRPEEIDFSDKNWSNVDYGSIEDKINKTIQDRNNDLNIKFTKNPTEDDFQNDSLWLKKNNNVKVTTQKEAIKIDPIDIELKGTIILKNKKKVRFMDEDEKLKERVMKLEKEVSEVKRQIREVLSENLMKNTGTKNISHRN